MKIGFENKTETGYTEIFHQIKVFQESCESVVPDTHDDIGKIATVQAAVHLKSKDLSGRGVLISGEAVAALVYITENENSTSFVRLSKSFSVEYEIQGIDADVIPQIKLNIQNTEARIINPRKISLTFEISGELSCYKKTEFPVDTVERPDYKGIIHTKYDKAQIICINAVSEKSFTLSEQLVFSSGKPSPSQIAMVKTSFDLNESQNVGSKLIVKGSMNLCVCYLSEDVNYPVKAEFSCPFSQIIDIGVDDVDSFATAVELSAVYYDIIDTISGEKALDAEIHAVLQISSSRNREIRYISDAYSNIMPAELTVSRNNYTAFSSMQQLKLVADERITVVDDCMDVLSVFIGIGRPDIRSHKFSSVLYLDIIYRTKSGTLSSVKRLVDLSSECSSAPERITSLVVSDVYLRPDGAFIDVHAAVDLKYQSSRSVELSRVTGAELDEENPFDFDAFPTLYLVRAESDELWELAKKYHSSIARISSSNNIEDGTKGKLLLIPKCV